MDGRFVASVDGMTVARHQLSVGQTLTPAALAELSGDAALARLLDRCLHFLSYRPRSETEIRDYLRRQEASPEQIDALLEDLRRQHFLDDVAFAQFWRESRDRFSPRGEGMLRAELRAKGVATEHVAEVLPDAAEEGALARRAAERQVRLLRGLEWPDFRKKLLGFLQRRGFGYEVANQTARQLWAELTAGEDHGDGKG